VLPFGQKQLSPLATFTLEAASFRAYAQLLALVPFFNCGLKVMFCEVVQHVL
jgi:hypothetical protein